MTLTGHEVSDGITVITICVSGNGHATAEMTAWMLIHGKADAGIISCEKRQCGGAWVPAAAQKPTYELIGQMVSGGAVIDEWVGREKSDPAIEFRITFDRSIDDTAIRLAYITGDTIHQSTETIHLGPPENAPKVWHTRRSRSRSVSILSSQTDISRMGHARRAYPLQSVVRIWRLKRKKTLQMNGA